VRLVRSALAVILGLAMVSGAMAQVPSVAALVGFLEVSGGSEWRDAFRHGLSDLGYVEGRTVVIEPRDASGRYERLPDLAAELVRLHPSVLVASDPLSAVAAKNATSTIPIVMANSNDAVGMGLVKSLARPGGNVTGLSTLSTGLSGKRLELLAALVPGLSRVGVVWHPALQPAQMAYRDLQAAAKALHFSLESFEVTRSEDLDPAFQAASQRTGAVAVLNSPIMVQNFDFVVAAAARHKVPAIYYSTEFTHAGGLMSFGANLSEMHRRAAVYVDKILKGAKPGDLPVEQPTKFELVVNLKAAKALGLAIPPSFLVRADEVIE